MAWKIYRQRGRGFLHRPAPSILSSLAARIPAAPGSTNEAAVYRRHRYHSVVNDVGSGRPRSGGCHQNIIKTTARGNSKENAVVMRFIMGVCLVFTRLVNINPMRLPFYLIFSVCWAAFVITLIVFLSLLFKTFLFLVVVC